MTAAHGAIDGLLANVAQIGSDFVSQHFFEAEPEQMGSIATVRASGDITAATSRSLRTSMTSGATIGESGANRAIGIDVTNAISFVGSLPLEASELPLKQLPTTADGAKRVALDDEDRRVPAISIAASSAHLGL